MLHKAHPHLVLRQINSSPQLIPLPTDFPWLSLSSTTDYLHLLHQTNASWRCETSGRVPWRRWSSTNLKNPHRMANDIFIYRYTESLHSQSRTAMNLNGNALHNVRLSPIHRLQEDSSVGSPIVLDPPPWRRARNSPCADTHFGVVREHLPFDGADDAHEPVTNPLP